VSKNRLYECLDVIIGLSRKMAPVPLKEAAKQMFEKLKLKQNMNKLSFSKDLGKKGWPCYMFGNKRMAGLTKKMNDPTLLLQKQCYLKGYKPSSNWMRGRMIDRCITHLIHCTSVKTCKCKPKPPRSVPDDVLQVVRRFKTDMERMSMEGVICQLVVSTPNHGLGTALDVIALNKQGFVPIEIKSGFNVNIDLPANKKRKPIECGTKKIADTIRNRHLLQLALSTRMFKKGYTSTDIRAAYVVYVDRLTSESTNKDAITLLEWVPVHTQPWFNDEDLDSVLDLLSG